jgi:hypothetical protein
MGGSGVGVSRGTWRGQGHASWWQALETGRYKRSTWAHPFSESASVRKASAAPPW